MQSYPLHTHNVVYFSFLDGSKRTVYVESYQWQIGLERILILPLPPCGFDTPYLSLPPLEIATMIPCTWGLSEGLWMEEEGRLEEGGAGRGRMEEEGRQEEGGGRKLTEAGGWRRRQWQCGNNGNGRRRTVAAVREWDRESEEW